MSKTIILINNKISSMMAECALKNEKIDPSQVVVFLLRDLSDDWLNECFKVFKSPHGSKTGVRAKIELVVFHIKSFRYLKKLVEKNQIKQVYLVNNDNILTNFLLNNNALEVNDVCMNVLVEGLMNFQVITLKNRSKLSVWGKVFLSFLLGFKYKAPTGHLSGAYMDVVKKVYSFSSMGLKSPDNKVRVCREFSRVKRNEAEKSNSVLLVLSGLYQWMSESDYELFCIGFKKYLDTLSFDAIKVKPHPRCMDDPIFKYLPSDVDVLSKDVPLEKMIEELDVRQAIGFCSTAVAILHIIDPKIECYDYGADIYCNAAYFGDQSVFKFFDGVGVKMILAENC